jgi:hypothetical protein
MNAITDPATTHHQKRHISWNATSALISATNSVINKAAEIMPAHAYAARPSFFGSLVDSLVERLSRV